jgi:hypothetical protein
VYEPAGHDQVGIPAREPDIVAKILLDTVAIGAGRAIGRHHLQVGHHHGGRPAMPNASSNDQVGWVRSGRRRWRDRAASLRLRALARPDGVLRLDNCPFHPL